jgi:archaetidylinositol phosphate synthase
MRPPAKRHAVVVDRDVGVVVLGLGELAHAVDERQSRDEGAELERALERVVDLGPALLAHGASIYHRAIASTETAPSAPLGRRAGRELLLESVFRPLSNLVLPLFLRAKVAPPAVVVANAIAGLVAALLVARGDLVAAAIALQLKTLLDNVDGQLARASGRVTLAGRYLDTVADLVVNAALFVALGYATGRPLLAAAAFVALIVVLAVDFNVTELYREAHGVESAQPRSSGDWGEMVLVRIYALVFAPLDRAVRSFATRRLGVPASYDRFTVTALANLGLTTQLVVLGICLVLDRPAAYLWFTLVCLAALVPLHLRAERRARAAVAS